MEGSAPQAGFYYQNNVAALKIIECLFFNTDITHILLENYEKGNHIDDIIIYRKNKIDYHQVKWSNDGEKSYTLYNLLTAQPPQKSIFKQLAEGYISAKRNIIDFSIILFTTKRESSQKRPGEGINYGLSEIINEIIKPLKQSKLSYTALLNYGQYKDILNKIRLECGLNEDSFDDFLRKLEFMFSQEATIQIQSVIKFKLDKLGIEENLFEKLLDGVVKWSITGELITKNKVIIELGISDRFEDKLSQYFKVVDEKYYIPNKDFHDKLNMALNELNGGYIFIEGLPGIGKSTSLTKFKEINSDITFAYYCFIPEAKNGFGELRHKSNYFLKSMCVAIENNFPNVDLPNKYSDRFEEKFNLYIDKLGTLKKKIIFIIDGLDHVHRDLEFNETSLLNQIKGNLPDGVFILLSSQYKTVLSSSVLAEINSDKRRHIIVSKFSQREIIQYLSNKCIIADDIIDHIERISGGIPIYLHYISELLIKSDKNNYENVLNDLPDLIDGLINSYHEYLFHKIENNEFANWVLAVLAYRKEHSNIETISEILKLAGVKNSIIEVQNVLNTFSHLLRQIDGRSYSIFHNSFREFILSKTFTLKEKFNKALVSYYEQTPYSDEAYRNYFRHLSEIEDYQKIISVTTLEWIKAAWKNFRTLSEIKENLELALNACIEKQSLSDFIKIGFLKAQVAQLDWNITNSEIDFPILFLNANLEQNSIRSIWDGDFILPSKGYFASYLCKYHTKTGNILPHNVIQQGLSKALIKGNSNLITTVLQAEALVSEDIVYIFNNIDKIKWEKSDRLHVGYFKENFSQNENTKTNLNIKFKIIDFLLEHKKFDHLVTLSKAFEADIQVYMKVQITLAKLLLPNEKKSAVKLLKSIDFNELSNETYYKLISYCCDYLSNDEILGLFEKLEINSPELHEKVITNEGINYNIHKDIIDLNETLKPIWVFQPDLVKKLMLKVSTLSNPSKSIYNSIFYLSEIWNKERHEMVSESDKCAILKTVLNELYIKRSKEFRKVNYGLFDNSFDDNFIAGSIDSLFQIFFKYATEKLTEKGIVEIINYWFLLEDEGNGYRHYKIALSIAKVIYSSQYQKLFDPIIKLIQHAEKIARYEEETITLTMYLGEVANAYGICGFSEDFNRIYNQLFEIAFGVAHRKDYQASFIISPLEALHKNDPNNTLKRLSEVFTIQNKLGEAGNSRMHHICISELIAFTAKYYPELGFYLIHKEEMSIGRNESLDIVLKSLIKASSKENLPLFNCIIKTIPRWEKSGISENYFLNLSVQLFERAIQLKDEAFIDVLLETVKHIAIVELEEVDILKTFSEILLKHGKDINQYSLPVPVIKRESIKIRTKLSQDEKFNLKCSQPIIDELITLFENDYEEFEIIIQSKYEICIKNRRTQTLRNEFYRSKSTFEKYYKSLKQNHQTNDIINLKRVIRNYLEFKKSIFDYNPKESLKSSELEILFGDFVLKTNTLFPDNTFKLFIKNEFEIDKWIETILKFTNQHHDFIFSQVIPEENVYRIVEETSILYSERLISFVTKWTSGRTNAISLLKIANRLVVINPEKAKEILYRLTENESDNLLFLRSDEERKIGFNIIETFIRSDPSFGKRFLLKNYISQKGKYGNDLIANIDILLLYEQYFDDANVSKAYYDSNLQYNKELAKGLPEKENNYDFISLHEEQLNFSEVVIKYIINLFEYPVVKVRELALQSLFDLVVSNSKYLKAVFKFGIKNGSDNITEYCLVMFHAISFKYPGLLIEFKIELLSICSKNHFNILESIKELLIRLNNYKHGFLNVDEFKILNGLNTLSPIIYNSPKINPKKGQNFIYSEYQGMLLEQLFRFEDDLTNIQDDVYNDLMEKNLIEYSLEKEGMVHRSYNINNNFDTIEINSTYYEEVKSSINRIFNSKIKRGCFEKDFVNHIKNMFRLFDPSKLLYRVKLRPDYINWMPNEILETDFIDFNDIGNIIEQFNQRENDYITLLEYGSQRLEENHSENKFTCYFEVFSFMKKKGFDDSLLEKRGLSTTIKGENYYAYELSTPEYNSINFPIEEIKPLLQISLNNFRGESDLLNASLLNDVYTDLGLEKSNLLDLLIGIEDYPIEAFHWQNSYTSFGRRRYKPISEGFTIKIKKEILSIFLMKNDMDLCYDISLKRSATKYRPEENMEWHDLSIRVELKM